MQVLLLGGLLLRQTIQVVGKVLLVVLHHSAHCFRLLAVAAVGMAHQQETVAAVAAVGHFPQVVAGLQRLEMRGDQPLRGTTNGEWVSVALLEALPLLVFKLSLAAQAAAALD